MKKDIFGDDIESSVTDFGKMLDGAEKSIGSKFKVGDKLSAVEILTIGKDDSFVSLGVTKDAVIETRELMDENKNLKYKVGDRIDVYVTLFRDGEIRVSKKKGTKGEASELEDAFDHMLPVEGRVSEVVNGGVSVVIMGKTTFCPISQLDIKFVEDPKEYLNKKFDFLITKMEGRNVVVSRKKLLSQQKEENIWAFRDDHKVGDIVSGEITRLEKFGAFIQIAPQVDALIHISELGWSRIQNPAEAVKIGDHLQVKIIKMEEVDGKLKISASRKQAEQDPWNEVKDKFYVGSIHSGVVVRKESYGYFVQLEAGVVGLMPKSSWKDEMDQQKFDNIKLQDKVTVQVKEVNMIEKRISLSPPVGTEDSSWREFSAQNKSNLGTLADQFNVLFEKKKK